MKIAILGATSEIAKDLILSFSAQDKQELVLFARRPKEVIRWLSTVNLPNKYAVYGFESFHHVSDLGAIINFVGVGNPAQAAAMGASIFDVTLKYDTIALNYLDKYPSCRYIFLSSGAAYGTSFNEPVTEATQATAPINNFQPQDWYGVAKLYAECRHRSLPYLSIIDIRVFNYFSSTQNMDARFLITDIVRAIRDKATLKTSSEIIVRDYISSEDFYQLISRILNSSIKNDVVDCYSNAPIDKPALLNFMQENFGLQYELVPQNIAINTGNVRSHYFSLNRRARQFGYAPIRTSLENLEREFNLIFKLSPTLLGTGITIVK